ncbi:MAG: UDP-glucose 4-epimerase GalE [Candidatus Babeliales bacterium]
MSKLFVYAMVLFSSMNASLAIVDVKKGSDAMEQKTVLVTGGAGYIGSHIAHALAQQGYRVLVLDIFKYNQPFNPSWATVIRGNCGDRQLLDTIFTEHHVHAIVHCAADIEVGRSVTDPLAFYHNNVNNTVTLIEAMVAHHVHHFIFSSSCAVYGTPLYTPIDTNHPINPISPYGYTKSVVERVLADCDAAYGLRSVTLRYFNAAGALPEEDLGERHEPETHAIPLLLTAAQQEKPFMIFGTDYPTRDGSAIRDYVHVRDIAHAHVLALQYLEQGSPSDIFNLGTENGVSVKELINTVQTIIRKEIKVVQQPRRVGDPAILVADANKAHAILHWKPVHSNLEFIIKSAAVFANQRATDICMPQAVVSCR